MRSDFQIGDSEIEFPEKELLRSNFSPKNFPLQTISPPNVKGFPPPAPLAFTPLTVKTNAVDIVRSDFLESAKAEEVEPVSVDQHVEVCEAVEKVEVAQEESDWETIEDSENDCETIEDSENDCENDFPAIDVNCEDWAEKYTESIHRFHSSGNYRTVNEQDEKCPNCDRVFTTSVRASKSQTIFRSQQHDLLNISGIVEIEVDSCGQSLALLRATKESLLNFLQ